jgi:hypothetical protein
MGINIIKRDSYSERVNLQPRQCILISNLTTEEQYKQKEKN